MIETYRRLFPDSVAGLSSHDNGIAMATAAFMLGARIVEKHFTLDRTMRGTDHSFSLEPQGLSKLVRDLERVHQALGDGVKRVYDSEVAPITKMGKSICAVRDLPAGHVIESDDLCYKSPGGGLLPSEHDNVIGTRLRKPLRAEDPVELRHHRRRPARRRARDGDHGDQRSHAGRRRAAVASLSETLAYVGAAELERIRALDADPVARTAAVADACRINTLSMIAEAGSGHIGTSFSCMEILCWLHLEVLAEGDRSFSSKGHDAPGLYSVLAAAGTLEFDKLHTLRRLGGLPGAPRRADHAAGPHQHGLARHGHLQGARVRARRPARRPLAAASSS